MKAVRYFFKGLRGMFDILLLFVIIASCYGVYYVYSNGYVDLLKSSWNTAAEIASKADASDFTRTSSGVSYYDVDDNPILMSYGGRYLSYDEIPQAAVDAVVAVEDTSFFAHRGIDLKGIARAAVHVIESGGSRSQGGSTVTQQLMKLKYLSSEKTYERKLTEVMLALLFEEKFTKEEIMEYYLNTIYFSNQYYGIDAASYGYFGKDVTSLSTAQVAYILAIPNSPARYDPYEHPDDTKARQERVLLAMKNGGFLKEKEYEEAVNETIRVLPKGNRTDLVDNRRDYPFSYIEREAVRAIMAADGFEFEYYFDSEEEKEAYNERYESACDKAKQKLQAGCIVHTSVDKNLQDLLQKSVDKFMDTVDKKKTDENVYEFQSASVCINNKTGLVTAIVGGRSDGSFLNRAWQSHRQPGSTIKPVLVYTPAIELKGYTPDTVVNDHFIEDGCKNADGRYRGDLTLRNAVSASVNTIAWQLFNEVGPKKGLSYLKKMQFSQIVDEDCQLASGIGGLTHGVSPLEMASAYAALYNDGKWRTPTCITKIYDSTGNCIYDSGSIKPVKVYKKHAADTMVNIMESVFDGTARGLSVDGFCAGKTGTTNDCKDSWFCGMTDEYTLSVWTGRDDGKSMGSHVSGAGYSGKIWHNFMADMKKQQKKEKKQQKKKD